MIGTQQRAGALQRCGVLHAGQHVAQQPVGAVRVRDPIGGDVRNVELLSQAHQRAQQRRIFGPHVMLQLEVEPAGKGIAQPRAQRNRGVRVAPQQRFLDDAVAAARERDQAVGAALEIVEPQPRIAFAPPQLGGRNQPRQVAETALVGCDQHQARRIGRDFFRGPGRTAGPDRFRVGRLERQLGTAQRRERRAGGSLGEADHPVQPVPVGQRDPAQAQAPAVGDQLLRVRGPLEEAEVRPAVELNVRGYRHRGTPRILEHTFDIPCPRAVWR